MRSQIPTRFTLLAVAVIAMALLSILTSCRTAGEWPRRFGSGGGSFVAYEPQPETLQGDVLTGRMAFSLQRTGERTATFGVMWFRARVSIDRDSSTCLAIQRMIGRPLKVAINGQTQIIPCNCWMIFNSFILLFMGSIDSVAFFLCISFRIKTAMAK